MSRGIRFRAAVVVDDEMGTGGILAWGILVGTELKRSKLN